VSTNPDLAAFLRAALADPADHLTRLVFADWLDETGKPANQAWAKYLRARADASGAASHFERDLAIDQAASAAPDVVARLTLPAAGFAPRFLGLLDLLPAANFTVTLDGFDPPRIFFRRHPQSFFERARAVPLALDQDRLLVAAASPHTGAVRALFERDFGAVAVVLVGADCAAIWTAIDRGYYTPPHVVERPPSAVVTPRVLTVADRFRNTSAVGVRVCLEHLLAEAREQGATAVEVVANESEHVIRYRVAGRTAERYRVPSGVGSELVRVARTVPPARLGAAVQPRNTSFGDGLFLNLQARLRR
jgi:uncharacterized protein (TIGR02996 family)